jgi:hypothetical protein
MSLRAFMNVFFLELSGQMQRYEIESGGWFQRQTASMDSSQHFSRAAGV